MIQIEETIVRKLIIHRVTSEENTSTINDSLVDFSVEDEESVLKRIFLKPFLSHAQTFEFTHKVSTDYNVLFNLSRSIHEGEDFIKKSGDIVRYLISLSKHPNIKDGDLFIAKFDDIKLNNKFYEALGIYKFEDKESFIETSISNSVLKYSFRKGIGNKKPDKACLIILSDEPYTILIMDSNTNDTDYWQNDFINRGSKNDNVNSTNNFLTLTKNFITTQIPGDFEVSKADQIDFLNRSVDYFKQHEMFDKQQFEEEVFGDGNVIESFRRFDQTYRQENDLDLSDNFEISAQAVKKQARVFKSVLKLDKNFHIYIHGNRELIEQGTDENGRKYYKIYYEQES